MALFPRKIVPVLGWMAWNMAWKMGEKMRFFFFFMAFISCCYTSTNGIIQHVYTIKNCHDGMVMGHGMVTYRYCHSSYSNHGILYHPCFWRAMEKMILAVYLNKWVGLTNMDWCIWPATWVQTKKYETHLRMNSSTMVPIPSDVRMWSDRGSSWVSFMEEMK